MTDPATPSEWYPINGFCIFFDSTSKGILAMLKDEVPGHSVLVTSSQKSANNVVTYLEVPVGFERAKEIALAVGGRLDNHQREFYRKN